MTISTPRFLLAVLLATSVLPPEYLHHPPWPARRSLISKPCSFMPGTCIPTVSPCRRLTSSSSHEPDPTTHSRAVPIYATTVGLIDTSLRLSPLQRLLANLLRSRTNSMIRRTAPDSSV